MLHLHGSLYVYPSEYEIDDNPSNEIAWLQERARPVLVFDPDSVTHMFSPYKRPPIDITGYRMVDERIIAPVPDKAEGLAGVFIKAVRERVIELVRASSGVVAIGYGFNRPDRSSYHSILKAIEESGGRLILVTPQAETIAARLRDDYRTLECVAVPRTFRRWVDGGFPTTCPAGS